MQLPDLARRCQCGHPYGDHTPDPPHRCLSLASPPAANGDPPCDCTTWQEATQPSLFPTEPYVSVAGLHGGLASPPAERRHWEA